MQLKTNLVSGLWLLAISACAGDTCWQGVTCDGPATQAFPGDWDSNIFSPMSRHVNPIRILHPDHQLLSKYPGNAHLSANQQMVIYDFGQNVGGVITLHYAACGSGNVGLAFSEARNFTGVASDESNGGSGPDGALTFTIDASACDNSAQNYKVPVAQQRGGFRYLTVFVDSSETLSLDISSVSLEISFQPTWSNLRAYGGYFDSNDQDLNRIWYASAYTIQMTAIAPHDARPYPLLNTGWANDAYLGGEGGSFLVDGAKRDRATWSGDLGIATRSALVSTCDQESVRNALQLQFDYQQSSGELPMVGPPISFFGSDTYHLSTLIGTYDYLLFSGHTDFLNSIWDGYKKGMSFMTSKIDDSGMVNVSGGNNWGRVVAASTGHTTDGNMLMYGALISGAAMAQWQGESDLAKQYLSKAQALKEAVHKANYDAGQGAYKNSDHDGSVYPEDGNSMALYYGGVNSSVAESVSDFLYSQWTQIGAVTQELPGNIVPYIESFEIKGHLAVGNAQRALDLMRRSWGWYLNSPHGTASTTPEGYYADGSFKYRDANYNKGGAYTSHAHGWSTGPADALTSYIVGLQPTGLAGKTWTFSPQFGDLKRAEGGFTTPLGQFSAGWRLVTCSGDMAYKAWVTVPEGTSGTVSLPGRGGTQPRHIEVNGKTDKATFHPATGMSSVDIQGGTHRFKVIY